MVRIHPALNRPEQPACSICIANYNGVELLGDCLDSIFNQQCGFSFEVIVHDDASPDASVQFLRERYPQVEMLASDENVGFCIGNNRMAAHARGEYVLLLNNDAALFPDALAALMADAQQQSPRSILTLPQYDWQTGELVDRGCLLDPFCNPIPNLDVTRTDVAYVIGACLWCPRDAWTTLGGFPEWMESLAEDLYLCGMARLRGMQVHALPTSGYRHRQGASFGGNRVDDTGLSTTSQRRRLSERNKTRALIILTPGFAMWPLLLLHLCALLAEGAAMSLFRRDTTLWRDIYAPAIATPFRETRDLLTRRHEIQAMRTISIAQWFSAVRWQLRKIVMLRRYGVPTVR